MATVVLVLDEKHYAKITKGIKSKDRAARLEHVMACLLHLGYVPKAQAPHRPSGGHPGG